MRRVVLGVRESIADVIDFDHCEKRSFSSAWLMLSSGFMFCMLSVMECCISGQLALLRLGLGTVGVDMACAVM